ncbi:spermidine/putrescine ABC transporter substrate-binding protein [Reinekea sp.]|jgi:spermidine/putrescine transport system substrate-binding protein|uniref:polyamine ABC transporter substrate-binding protein n=1 Tax=Reinekea sp. TaxID=1970455 RepID=UPI002A82A174|nr:spermidine/putrescine ABC transporter substrate-binding protein [Reinekea sp.]
MTASLWCKICIVTSAIASLAPIGWAEPATLRLLTWENYFDPELIGQFEREHQVTIQSIYYDNDEVRDQIMAENQGNGFDLILVDDIKLPTYIEQGWLAPITTKQLVHLGDHGDLWHSLVPGIQGYAIPYSWGTYGISYRSDLLDAPPTRWADLFEPNDQLTGFIQMLPQASELLVIALLAQGDSPNTNDTVSLAKALDLLTTQKDRVAYYRTLDFDDNLLNQGLVKAAVSYNSDALALQDLYDNIEFVVPTEGSALWIDYWTLSANSKQTELALAFFDFLLEPVNNAQNVNYHYSATFSAKAKALLPAELRDNQAVFPAHADSFETLKRPSRSTIRTMMRIINNLDID